MCIFEERIYTIQPGRLNEYLKRYRDFGYKVQTKHLGKPIGYFTSEIGDLNLVIQLRQYESYLDRNTRRLAMESDPDWIAYRKSNSLQIKQKNRILKSLDFCSLHCETSESNEN
ncbi:MULTISPECIES: NIPSNAP family protein [Vibrio]|uniref:NIPSNAP family protein n=1 Tax=Vibrio TaxID=662 RepID=UPI000D3B8381|nr:NIPSNAP family protein [Vibrio splendidus]